MADIVVDTHILTQIIASYNSAISNLEHNEELSPNYHKYFQKLILNEGKEGYLVTSTLSIIEIINQFDLVSENKYSKEKMLAFIQQPPSWFLFEDVNIEIAKILFDIPSSVIINNELEAIELNDAIHVATALLRGDNAKLCTYDRRIRALPIMEGKII